jgi:hypothetical protein
MDNLKQFLDKLAKEPVITNENANGTLTIQQTLRNQLRAKMMQALFNDLVDFNFDAYQTADGLIIAVEHDEVGTISVEIKTTIKSLDYDPQVEADAFEEMLQDKEADKQRKAEAKKRKIELDKGVRAKKKAAEEADTSESEE